MSKAKSSPTAHNGPELRIGISGWTYPPWRGVFYPADLAHRRELEFASRQVNSIEINGTFYALQKPASFQKWYEMTPEDFVFSVKGNRFITHTRRLKEVEVPLANFFASGVLELGRKLGPVLWQFPPNFKFDPARVENFFKLLPRTMEEAAELAQNHDRKIKDVVTVGFKIDGPVRHAMEIRHPSFATEEFISLLREYNVAIVVADTAGKWPFIEDVTADFIYVRLHGDAELYASGYSPEALDRWAKKIERWSLGGSPRGAKCISAPLPPRKEGRSVHVYFDNDIKVHAPFDAISLGSRFGLAPLEPSPMSMSSKPG
jgi:uncharacterized protein YecE (DUF72 family)